jgi:hypothetical protein
MRAVKILLGVVLLCGLLFGATAALGSSAPMMGGAVQFWVTPSPTGNGGQVLITGAIGDYGKAQNVTAAGKAAPKKSAYKDLMLKNGTILINLTKYMQAQNNANPTMYNKINCSAYLSVSAPATIVSGTGAYKGIRGTVTLHAENAALLPKTKKGSCNENANPVNDYVAVNGSGTVTFG